MGFYEELIAGLKESIECDFDGKISRLAAKAETHTSTLSRLVTGERKEWLSLLARVADAADLTVISRKSFVNESLYCLLPKSLLDRRKSGSEWRGRGSSSSRRFSCRPYG